jgi:hypothetical protein
VLSARRKPSSGHPAGFQSLRLPASNRTAVRSSGSMNKRRNHTDPSVLQIRRSSLDYHGWTEFISRSSRNAALGSASPSMITRACRSGTVLAGSTERIFLSTVATSFETAWSGTAPDQRRSCGPRNASRLSDGNVACRDRDGALVPMGQAMVSGMCLEARATSRTIPHASCCPASCGTTNPQNADRQDLVSEAMASRAGRPPTSSQILSSR